MAVGPEFRQVREALLIHSWPSRPVLRIMLEGKKTIPDTKMYGVHSAPVLKLTWLWNLSGTQLGKYQSVLKGRRPLL